MTAISTTQSLLLPRGTRVLHIGPPKTGTTTLQYAFHATRRECRKQGVRYAGVTHQPAKAARAAMGVNDPVVGKPPSKLYWRVLLSEIRRASESRVVISSESFAQAPPEAIRRIVSDLDPGRVHVVVTLRPLARVLTSHWQQAVQNGLRQSLDPWLETVFDEPDSWQAASFWLRHRHDELIARWAAVVGIDNVTVVPLDGRDHARVLRVFEQLVGLREQTLPSIDDAVNRSLTLPEAKVVQAINERFQDERLDPSVLKQLVTFGAAAYMKALTPDRDEPRITLPSWAEERAEAIAASMMAKIDASGVRVVGDLDGMVRSGPRRPAGDGTANARDPESTSAWSVPPRAAGAAAIGIVLMAGHGRDVTGVTDAADGSTGGSRSAEGSPESDLGSSLYLLAIIANRFRSWLGGDLHRIRRSLRRGAERPARVMSDAGATPPGQAG